jgi:exopolysaccharide biosynthesis predicted pyruvyltransferase EpsI
MNCEMAKDVRCNDLVSRLARSIDDVLSPLISTGTRCALVDFPYHPNVGDSAIWLGETAWLARRDVQIVYCCDTGTYSREKLAATLEDGVILIHGGGNLGDLWQNHQDLRERIIRDFPDRPIIQLPQTIHFRKRKAADDTCKILDAHSNLMILCRDQQSLDFARRHFAARSELCPDMAFALGPLSRVAAPHQDVVWLSRSDEESQALPLPQAVPGVQVLDWLDEPDTPEHDQAHEWRRQICRNPEDWRSVLSSLMASYNSLAAERVRRGRQLLSSGKVVIADRLHGHILCLLQGIPHVVVDNNYGKNRSFYEAWTHSCELTSWANSPTEALVVAQRMLGEFDRC